MDKFAKLQDMGMVFGEMCEGPESDFRQHVLVGTTLPLFIGSEVPFESPVPR